MGRSKISSYELNPPFAMFCKVSPSMSDTAGTELVRYESLVAGDSGTISNFLRPDLVPRLRELIKKLYV